MRAGNRNWLFIYAAIVLGLFLLNQSAAVDSDALKAKLKDTQVSDLWIYDDFEQAKARAKETGKPLFVVFR
jgi:hypothetical protein